MSSIEVRDRGPIESADPELKNEARIPGETRMTLRLSAEAKAALDWLSKERGGVSYAEVIRRALGTEQFLMEMRNKNASILIEEPGSKRLKELILR